MFLIFGKSTTDSSYSRIGQWSSANLWRHSVIGHIERSKTAHRGQLELLEETQLNCLIVLITRKVQPTCHETGEFFDKTRVTSTGH